MITDCLNVCGLQGNKFLHNYTVSHNVENLLIWSVKEYFCRCVLRSIKFITFT